MTTVIDAPFRALPNNQQDKPPSRLRRGLGMLLALLAVIAILYSGWRLFKWISDIDPTTTAAAVPVATSIVPTTIPATSEIPAVLTALAAQNSSINNLAAAQLAGSQAQATLIAALSATPTASPTATATITPTLAISGTATAEPNMSADLAVATPEGGYEDLGRTHENALRIGMALGFGDSVTITRVDPPVGGRRQFFCFLLNGEEMCGWCARTGTPALDVGDTATRIGDWVIPASRADQPIHIDPPNNGGNNNPVATSTRNVVTATNPPTATNQATYTPRPSYTPRNTSTVIPSDTPYPTDTERPNQPTNTPRPSYTPRSSDTPLPSDTPYPTDTLVPTNTSTSTPTSTSTRTPTITPTSNIIDDRCLNTGGICTPTPAGSTPTPDDRTPRSPTATPTHDCTRDPYPCMTPVPSNTPWWPCIWPMTCATDTPEPPTATPTECPTLEPTPTSTRKPTHTATPTDTPTNEPTVIPTDTPVPSICMQDWPKTPAQAYATLGWRDDWSAEYQANGSWGWKLAQSAKPPTRPFTPGICLNEGFSGDPQQWTAIGNGDKVTELLLKFPGGNGGTVWNETRVEIAEYVFCKTWKNILLRPDHPNWTPWAFGFPKPKFCDGIPVPQANSPILQFVPTGQINRRFVPKGTINRRFVPKATPRRLIVVATAVPEPQVEVAPNGDPVAEAPPPPEPEQVYNFEQGDFTKNDLVVILSGTTSDGYGIGEDPACRLTGYEGNGTRMIVPHHIWMQYKECSYLPPR